MYVVDLRRAGYYQKCHDPDCRVGYRSPLRPIPCDIIPETVHNEGSGFHNLEWYNDKNTVNNSTPDSWWLEAMRFADSLEKRRDLSAVSNMFSIFYSLAEDSSDIFSEAEKEEKTPLFLFVLHLTLFIPFLCKHQTGKHQRGG